MIIEILAQIYFVFFLISAVFAVSTWLLIDSWLFLGFVYSAVSLYLLFFILKFFGHNYQSFSHPNLTSWSLTFFTFMVTLPFFVWGPFLASGYYENWIGALFDTISSITGTGSTVLSKFIIVQENVALSLWRSVIAWVSAIISVLFIIVSISHLTTYNGFLYRLLHVNEMHNMWYVTKYCMPLLIFYTIWTGLGVLGLYLDGQTLVNSVKFSLQSISTTGGIIFNHHELGFISKLIMTMLMIFGATNITIHWVVAEYFINKSSQGISLYWQDKEFKTMVKIIIMCTIVLLLINYRSVWVTFVQFHSFLIDRLFIVTSIFTTTGWWYTDGSQMHLWLGLLLFVGGSIVSTTGGLKLLRFLVLMRFSINEINHVVSPYMAQKVAYGKFSLAYRDISAIGVFFMIFIFVYILFLLLLAFAQPELSLTQLFFFVLNAGTNGGESMRYLCIDCSYQMLSAAGQFLIMFLMILGRLELLTLYGAVYFLFTSNKFE